MQPSEEFIELLADTTESLCGYKPTEKIVKDFIRSNLSYITGTESSDVKIRQMSVRKRVSKVSSDATHLKSDKKEKKDKEKIQRKQTTKTAKIEGEDIINNICKFNPTGKKIESFIFEGEEIYVKTYKDILVGLADTIFYNMFIS